MSEVDAMPYVKDLVLPVGDDLEVRQLIPEDAGQYFNAVEESREHLGQYASLTAERTMSLQDAEEIIALQNERFAVFGTWRGTELVGSLTLCKSAIESSVYHEIGYWSSEQHAGQGNTHRALSAFTDFILQDSGARNVCAYIRQGNVASAATAQKAGFKYLSPIDMGDADYWLFSKFREIPEELRPDFADKVLDVRMQRVQTNRSVAWINLDGVNRGSINHGSDTTYQVLTGEVSFVVDNAIENVVAGGSIRIPKGTPYQDIGRATMYAVCEPAFDANKIEFTRAY